MKRELRKARKDIDKIRGIVFEIAWDKDGNYKKNLSSSFKYNFEKIFNDFRKIYFRLLDMEKEVEKR